MQCIFSTFSCDSLGLSSGSTLYQLCDSGQVTSLKLHFLIQGQRGNNRIHATGFGVGLNENNCTYKGASQVALLANAGDAGSIPGSEISWRRKWQLIPIFLPGNSHGQRSLAGYIQSIVLKQSDTTEHSINTHTHIKTQHCVLKSWGLSSLLFHCYSLMYFVSDFLLLKPGLAPFKI